jgi:hypothetical protein
MMMPLVLGSFVISLTPVALGLAWKLFFRIGRSIGLQLAPAFESAGAWRSLHHSDEYQFGRGRRRSADRGGWFREVVAPCVPR